MRMRERGIGSRSSTMRKQRKLEWLLVLIIIQHCYLAVWAVEAGIQENAEATIPIPTYTSPEGNTTFLGGTTWCVARPGVSQLDLQKALDWACGPGKTNCSRIQSGGDCFEPNTLLAHASFAFNTYYQQNGNSDIACNFGGTATLTKIDPSYKVCSYSASGLETSSSAKQGSWSFIWWGFLLLLYLRS